MPTIQASTLLDSASTLLIDVSRARWPEAELLDWLNAGQREIVLQRPEAYVVTRHIPLVAGTRQTLPDDAIRLINVVRNGNGRAVSLCNGDMLDMEDPDWHNGSSTDHAVHYVYDQHDPHVFYVYPPNTGQGNVEVIVSASPPDVADAGGVLSIDDIYANALIDYIVYRAFAKDSASSVNLQRATLAYQSFAAALGMKVKADTLSNPGVNTTPMQKVPPEAGLT